MNIIFPTCLTIAIIALYYPIAFRISSGLFPDSNFPSLAYQGSTLPHRK